MGDAYPRHEGPVARTHSSESVSSLEDFSDSASDSSAATSSTCSSSDGEVNEKLREFQDRPQVLEEGCRKLARLMNNARRPIFFTGAGISTSCGIPDFRGPTGVWTMRDQGKEAPYGPALPELLPSAFHMWLVALQDSGRMAYLVSQNVDGLHRRSGIRRDMISELHGNSFMEVCWRCGEDKEFLRNWEVDGGVKGHGRCRDCQKRCPYFCHCTSRRCSCGATLKDSVINFREQLPKAALATAFRRAKEADLCVVAGSSCTVSPACDVPLETVRNSGKLVIINKQVTPLDRLCHLRIYADTDTVARRVSELLLMTIPTWSPN